MVKLGNLIKTGLNYISAPLSQPKTFLTEGPKAAANRVASTRKAISTGQKSGLGVIATTLGSTLAVGGAVVGGSAAFAAGRAGTLAPVLSKAAQKAARSAAKGLVPSTLRGKIAVGTTGLLGVGVLKRSPKAREAAINQVKDLPKKPGKVIDLGEKIGGVIEGETPFGKDDVIKGAKTAGIIGGVAALGAAIIPTALGKLKNAPTIAPVTPQIGNIPKDVTPAVPPTVTPPTTPGQVKETPLGQASSPVLPQTTTITPTRTRSKRRTSKKKPSMSQNVRINIINSPKFSQSKKYLKQVVYV